MLLLKLLLTPLFILIITLIGRRWGSLVPRIAQRDGGNIESCPRSSRHAERDVVTR